MDQTFSYLMLWAAAFALVLVFFIKKGLFLGGHKVRSRTKSHLDRNFVAIKWQEIEVLMSQQKPSAYKVAIMEADKLVDYVLKAKVGTGGGMADRLKRVRKLFSNYSDYQNLWEAHKTRNAMVHDAEYELYFAEVKKVISFFEKALQELKVL